MNLKEIISGLQRDAKQLFDGSEMDENYFLTNYGIKDIYLTDTGIEACDEEGDIIADVSHNGEVAFWQYDGRLDVQNALFQMAGEMMSELPEWYFDSSKLKLNTRDCDLELDGVNSPTQLLEAIEDATTFYTEDNLVCPLDDGAGDHVFHHTGHEYRTEYKCDKDGLYFGRDAGGWHFKRQDPETKKLVPDQELNDKSAAFRCILRGIGTEIPTWHERDILANVSAKVIELIGEAVSQDSNCFQFLNRVDLDEDVDTETSASASEDSNKDGQLLLFAQNGQEVFLQTQTAETCNCDPLTLLNKGCQKHQ